MQLPNTREYYKDLAHHYFQKELVHLMIYFRNLAEDKQNEFAKADTRDWFKMWGIERPQKDEDGHYI